MEKNEPALKPEWLKSSNEGNHHNEHGMVGSLKNILSLTDDRDRSSFSSTRRSLSSNGPRRHDKDASGKSNAYSSFGGSNRSREREKEKDFYSFDRDNGFHVRIGSLTTSRPEKDSLRRSSSMVSGRPVDILSEGLGNNVNNGISRKGSIIAGTFEKDFPSLGAEEKNGRVEVARVSSPGISIGSATISRVDNWNSVLVEVPVLVGMNGLSSSSMPALVAPSAITGLNMAETVAQTPSLARTPPELSIDTQRIDELTLRQCKQLIPMTPSATKSSVLSPSEKLKNKGARGGDSSAVPKGGLQPSSQPINAAARTPVRTDTTKPSPHLGTFQVLNREKNGITTSCKEAPQNVGLSVKTPTSQKSRGEGKTAPLSSPQGSVLERRTNSQAKDRNEFFNLLRNKASNKSGAVPEPSYSPPILCISGNLDKRNSDGDRGGNAVFPNHELKHSKSIACIAEEADEMDLCSEPVDPEEEAFLRSLGWDKFAEVDALTPEEIEAFYMKNKERMKTSHN